MVDPDIIQFLIFENNYTAISLVSSLPCSKEAPICYKGIILKFQVERGLAMEKLHFDMKKLATSLKQNKTKT